MAPAAPVSCPRCEAELADVTNFCPQCGEPVRRRRGRAARPAPVGTGRVVGGRYRLLERLGQGGMGTVWRAEHVRMGKVLALKVLRRELATPRLRARFQEEARVVSQLSHPNTIQVFDAGELTDGSLYIAMEYLPGWDLARTLREQGPLPEPQVLAVASQVLASLAEAHALGIVHRDIKPANVMRVGDGRVKVLDFGIAKLTEGEALPQLTGTEDVVGTPAYMSPEQARGEPLDARSDLYSVGALLFELATGSPVYRGPNAMSVVAQHLDTQPPPRPSEAAPGRTFTPGFEALLQRALAKRPADRFQTAGAMRATVELLRRQQGGAVGERTPVPGEPEGDVARREDFARLERGARLRRALAPLLALLVVAGLGAGGWRLLRHVRAGQAGVVREVEREPNDAPGVANRVLVGEPVRGEVAGEGALGGADTDVFLLEGVEGPLTLELSAVAGLDLTVELLEPALEGLQRRLLLDDAPAGGPEHVDGYQASGTSLYVRVSAREGGAGASRPADSAARGEYTLWVRPAPAGGGEVEPNDAPASATRVAPGRAVTGRTGAFVEVPPGAGRPALSTVDHFVAAVPGPLPEWVAVAVVPPPSGALWLEDAAGPPAGGTTPAGMTAGMAAGPVRVEGAPRVLLLRRGPHGHVLRVLPASLDTPVGALWLEDAAGPPAGTPAGPVRAEGGPRVLLLRRGPHGHVLRVLPASLDTPVGAEYRAAFFHPGAGGRAGVEALAHALAGDGRLAERDSLLQQVEALLGPAVPDAGAFAGGGVDAGGDATLLGGGELAGATDGGGTVLAGGSADTEAPTLTSPTAPPAAAEETLPADEALPGGAAPSAVGVSGEGEPDAPAPSGAQASDAPALGEELGEEDAFGPSVGSGAEPVVELEDEEGGEAPASAGAGVGTSEAPAVAGDEEG